MEFAGGLLAVCTTPIIRGEYSRISNAVDELHSRVHTLPPQSVPGRRLACRDCVVGLVVPSPVTARFFDGE